MITLTPMPQMCTRCGGVVERVNVGSCDSWRCLNCYAIMHNDFGGWSRRLEVSGTPTTEEEEEAALTWSQEQRRRRLQRQAAERAAAPPEPKPVVAAADAVAMAMQRVAMTARLMEGGDR